MNDRAMPHTTNSWLELRDAAEYSGVGYDDLVDAVTRRQVRASTTHPARPGDWMVPVSDVDRWVRGQTLLYATHAVSPATPSAQAGEHWLDLGEAARRVRRPHRDIVDAVARQELAATVQHPARMGTWMVRLPALEAWADTCWP